MYRAALNHPQYCLIALNASLSQQLLSEYFVAFNLCYTAVLLSCHGDTLATAAVKDNLLLSSRMQSDRVGFWDASPTQACFRPYSSS